MHQRDRWICPIKPRGMLRYRLYAIAPACCKYVAWELACGRLRSKPAIDYLPFE